MKKYEQMAAEIIEQVGGKENITNAMHCMTRLRFVLKDAGIPDEERMKKIKGVMGCQFVGGQWQIIIGPDVSKVYTEVCKTVGLSEEKIINENMDSTSKKDMSLKGIGSYLLDYMVGSVVPIIPVFIVAGLIKAVMSIFGPQILNVIEADSTTYALLNFVNNAGFYFLPIYLGYSSAKKLNINPAIGMFLGGILIHPDFLAIVAKGEPFNMFGLSIPLNNYSSSMFPILLSVLVMSYIYKFLEKHMPASLNSLFTPFLSIMIMLPISLCLLAPLGNYVGIYLNQFFMLISDKLPWLPPVLFGAFYMLLVMTGTHMAIAASTFSIFTEVGYDAICRPGAYIANVAIIGVALGAWLRFKNKDEKNLSLSCFVSGMIGGVTEPTLFGIALRFKKCLLCAMAAGALGGLYAGLTSVKIYTFGSTPFLYPILYAGGDVSNIVNGVVSLLIAFIAGIVLTWFFGLKKEEIGE